MNSKPLLLSAAILAVLSACGGSGSDQAQPPPEQPQTLVPPPAPPPPPAPEDKTPEDKTPEPPPPPSPPPPPPPPQGFKPPKHPGMKEVPDYAKAMTQAEADQAVIDKQITMRLNLDLQTEITDGNVAEGRIKYLDVVITDPAKMVGRMELRPYKSPPDAPGKWHDGSWDSRFVLTAPASISGYTDPVKSIEEKVGLRAYEQYYSVLQRMGWLKMRVEYGDGRVDEKTSPEWVFNFLGDMKPVTDWPGSGNATYRGYAMDHSDNVGFLVYAMNFGTKKGEGTITKLLPGNKTIELQEATLQGSFGLEGDVTVDGANAYPDPAGGSDLTNVEYLVKFYGPQAEEILGLIEGSGGEDLAGFAGQQQAFTP